jgi:hypothetical protein
VFVASSASGFDWTKATLLELEQQNKNACDELTRCGLNGKALRLKAPRAPVALRTRISIDATELEKVEALAASNLNLSTITHIVGAGTVSSDEVLIAAQYRADKAKYEVEKGKHAELLKMKEAETAAKALLAAHPEGGANFTVKQLRQLLKWKMPVEEYKRHHVYKAVIGSLRELWMHYQNVQVEDTIVPEIFEQPTLPSLQATELGRAAERCATITKNCLKNLSEAALDDLLDTLHQHKSARVG